MLYAPKCRVDVCGKDFLIGNTHTHTLPRFKDFALRKNKMNIKRLEWVSGGVDCDSERVGVS